MHFAFIFLPIFALFTSANALMIIVKPENHRYQIRIYCGKTRKNLIAEGVQQGVQNAWQRADKQFMHVERAPMERAQCVADRTRVLVDVLYFNQVQISMLTTVGQLLSMGKLVLGMPGLQITTKTFVLPPSPENGQVDVHCLKQDQGGPASQYIYDKSGTNVTLGQTWGPEGRLALYGTEPGHSELKTCRDEQVSLALRDYHSGNTKWSIKMPTNLFLDADEIEVVDFWQKDMTNPVTEFTFDNHADQQVYPVNGTNGTSVPHWAYSVLVYCTRAGTADGVQSLLIFGAGVQNAEGVARVEMSPARELALAEKCADQKYRALVYRWSVVHANQEFDKFEEHIHMSLK